MKTMKHDTTCDYEEFRQEAINPPRTKELQRIEIEHNLDQLAAQGDFWSLDIIRGITGNLTEDTGEGLALYSLLHAIKRLPPEMLEVLCTVAINLA